MSAFFTTLIINVLIWNAMDQPKAETLDHHIKIAAGVSMLVASGVVFAYSDLVKDEHRVTPPAVQTKLDVSKPGLFTAGTFLVAWGIEE